MDDNLHNELVNKELNVMEIYLTAKSTRTYSTIEEYIQAKLAQGVSLESIQKELVRDLENNGPIFGEMRRVLKATAHGSMTRFRNVSLFAETGVDIKYRWTAVLVNTCPDCMKRHGEVKTWDQWEEEGLPQTGWPICEQRWGIGTCRCMLLPADLTELEPIKREAK